MQQTCTYENNLAVNNNYSKFIYHRGFIELECNSSKGTYSLAFFKTWQSNSPTRERKIVKALLKCFDTNYVEFNIFLIFNGVFEISYEKAICKNEELHKERAYSFFKSQHHSLFQFILPKDLICLISKIHYLLHLQPSCKEFQANMWTFISLEEDKKKIIKQLKK